MYYSTRQDFVGKLSNEALFTVLISTDLETRLQACE